MKHTGRWSALTIFGDFAHCLNEIKNKNWFALKPFK